MPFAFYFVTLHLHPTLHPTEEKSTKQGRFDGKLIRENHVGLCVSPLSLSALLLMAHQSWVYLDRYAALEGALGVLYRQHREMFQSYTCTNGHR